MASMSVTLTLKDQFTSTLNKAQTSLKNFKSTLANAKQSLENVANGSNTSSSAISKLNNTVSQSPSMFSRATSSIRSFISVVGGLTLVRNVFNMIGSSVETALNRIDTMDTFSRKMNLITGDAKNSEKALNALKESTTGTAYALDTATKAVQNFVTRGMSTDEAVKSTNVWMDVVAAYGKGTNEEFETVTDAIAKMRTKGTVEMKQLNRLFQVGVNPVQTYAQAVGSTQEEIQQLLSDKAIRADEFLSVVEKAYTEGTNGVVNVTGMARKAGTTWQGTIANMKIAIARGMVEIINALSDSFKPLNSNGLKGLVAGFGRVMEKGMGGVAKVIKATLLPTIAIIGGFYNALNTYLFEPLAKVKSAFKNGFLGELSEGISEFARNFKEQINNKVFPTLKSISSNFTDTFDNNVVETIRKTSTRVGEVFKDRAIPALNNIGNTFIEVFENKVNPKIEEFNKRVNKNIKGEVLPTFKELGKTIESVFLNNILRSIEEFSEKSKYIFEKFVDRELEPILVGLNNLKSSFGEVFKSIGNIIKNSIENATSITSQGFGNIRVGKMLGGLFTAIGNFAQITIPPVFSILSQMLNSLVKIPFDYLIPALQGLSTGIRAFFASLFGSGVSGTEVLQTLIKTFLAFKGISTIAGYITKFASTFAKLSLVFTSLFSPLKLVSALILFIGYSFIKAQMAVGGTESAFQRFANFAKHFGTTVGDFVGKFLDGFSGFRKVTSNAVNSLANFFTSKRWKANPIQIDTKGNKKTINNLTWFKDRLVKIYEIIVNTITNTVKIVALKFKKLSSVFNSMSNSSFRKFVDSIISGFKSLMDMIPSFSVKFIDLFLALSRAVGSVLVHILPAFGGFINLFASFVLPPALDLLTNILDWIADNGDLVASSLLSIVAGFIAFKTAIVAMRLPSTIANLGSAISGLAADLLNPIFWIPLLIAALVGLAVYITYLWKTSDKFRQFWIDCWNHENINGGLKEFCAGATTTIKYLIGFILRTASAVGWLVDTFNSVQGKTSSFGKELWEKADHLLFDKIEPTSAEDNVDPIQSFKESIGMDQMQQLGLQAGGLYSTGLADGIDLNQIEVSSTDFFGDVADSSYEMGEYTTDQFVEGVGIDMYEQYGSDMIGRINTGLQANFESTYALLGGYGGNIMAVLYGALEQVDALRIFKDQNAEIISDVDLMKQEVENKADLMCMNFGTKLSQLRTDTGKSIKTLVNVIENNIANLPNTFNQLGQDICDSLTTGLQSKTQQVLDATSDLVEQMKKTFTDALGIHSPSDYMIWIAEMMGLGLMKGFSTDQILSFFDMVVGDMKTSFENGTFDPYQLVNYLGDDATLSLIGKLNGMDMGEFSNLATWVYPVAGTPFHENAPFHEPRGNRVHQGIDLMASMGTPILSAMAGTVSYSGGANGTGYGNHVIVDHGNGIETVYAHFMSNSVKSGQSVMAGTQLGLADSTGNSTGSHLHFELWQGGTEQDPTSYLQGAQFSGAIGNPLANAIQQAYNAIHGIGGVAQGDIPYDPAMGVSQWTPTVLKALSILGLDSSGLYAVLSLMAGESSGRPNIIQQITDINSGGNEARGLMQVTPETFAAYAVPPYNKNIYDPLSNILASLNYQMIRYGYLKSTPGYAVGTRNVPEDMFAMIHEGEAILPKTQNPYSQSGGDYLSEIGSKIGSAIFGVKEDGYTVDLDNARQGNNYTNHTDNRQMSFNPTIYVQNNEQADLVVEKLDAYLAQMWGQDINTMTNY